MVRDVMLAVAGTAGDAGALEAAVALALGAGAHLAAVCPVSLPAPAASIFGAETGAAYLEAFHTQIRAEAAREAARLHGELAREGLSADVRMVETTALDPHKVLGVHARFADLSVLGTVHDDGLDGPAVRAAFSALLLDGGRPVLVVPPAARFVFPVRRAVLAWRPTREATRALHDAMPLLAEGAAVDVLDVARGSRDAGHDVSGPGFDIAAHVARHGFDVRTVVRRREGATVATRILGHCDDGDAQLLVAGGYGHSRAREWMLGGTTRRLLRDARVPILFSH